MKFALLPTIALALAASTSVSALRFFPHKHSRALENRGVQDPFTRPSPRPPKATDDLYAAGYCTTCGDAEPTPTTAPLAVGSPSPAIVVDGVGLSGSSSGLKDEDLENLALLTEKDRFVKIRRTPGRAVVDPIS